jgi:hypothetical protein
MFKINILERKEIKQKKEKLSLLKMILHMHTANSKNITI